MVLPNPLHIIRGGLGDGGDPETAPGNGIHTAPLRVGTEPVAPACSGLAAVARSHHVGGGPHGLAAFLAHPEPEPLETHFRHAGNAIRAAMDPAGENRAAEAGKAAYHIVVAIPLKMLAKTIRRGADVLDCAPDAPHILVLAVVIIGVIAAVILLG